jgi:hypothetical protein
MRRIVMLSLVLALLAATVLSTAAFAAGNGPSYRYRSGDGTCDCPCADCDCPCDGDGPIQARDGSCQ